MTSPSTTRDRRSTSRRLIHATGRYARIPAFLPLLAQRFANDRLRAQAIVEGHLMTDRPEVLFVCVHNAGRSQMASPRSWPTMLAEPWRFAPRGSATADTINPAVMAAVNELGIDLSQEFPKPLTTEAVRASDVVITMGCGDPCPIFPGKRYLDWDLEDPSGKDLQTVRRIRDEIDAHVKQLLQELVPDGSPA